MLIISDYDSGCTFSTLIDGRYTRGLKDKFNWNCWYYLDDIPRLRQEIGYDGDIIVCQDGEIAVFPK